MTTRNKQNRGADTAPETGASQILKDENLHSQNQETAPAGTDNATAAPAPVVTPPDPWVGVPPEIKTEALALTAASGGINPSKDGVWWIYISTEGESVVGRMVAPQDPAACIEATGCNGADLTRYALASIGARAAKKRIGMARFPALGTCQNATREAAIAAAMAKYPGMTRAQVEDLLSMLAKPKKAK